MNTLNTTNMKNLLFSLSLFITISTFAQYNANTVSINEKIVGKYYADSSEIKGLEYQFAERIYDTFLDTTTGFLTVQLRGLTKNGKYLNNTGNILQYDLKSNNLLWSKKFAYQTSGLQQFSKTIIYTTGNKSYCLDVTTGNELWEVKNNIYFVDPVDQIGVGYKFKSTTGYSNELEGIDLKTGRVIWSRQLNREYGWNNMFYTNDSTMIVVAAGLHAVNIYDGKGWDYNTITGEKDYSGTVAANAAGVVLGLLTGSFAISTGYNMVSDIVSNALVDSTYLYLASKEQLAKISKETGELVWQHTFAKNMASKSSIFMNDSTIYMINNGFAFMGNRQLTFGKPFIAAFNKQTGEQKYLTLIGSKDDQILSYQILENELYLVFKNKMAKYSGETGNLMLEKEFPKESFGELKYFIGDQVYVKNKNNDLVSLIQSDSTKMFVYSDQRKTLSIDNQLNVTDAIENKDIGIYYHRTKDLKFIAKGKQTLIINDKGIAIAEIEASSNAFMIDGVLYDKQEKSLIAIDLKEMIKNN